MPISTVYWSLLDIRTKIEADLDLSIGSGEESFISLDEFKGLVNEAIDRAEQTVHTIYEDYFLTRASISLISGTEEYALPDAIYAHKIRRVVYRNGSSVHEVPRIRDWRKFENYEVSKSSSSSSNNYGYFILNQTPGSPKILIAPTPNESGVFLQTWYIRGANRVSADADILDIPEAQNFILSYIRMKVYEKEMNPNLQKAMADTELEKSLLETTLTAMVPDTNNEIEADFSAYEEHI